MTDALDKNNRATAWLLVGASLCLAAVEPMLHVWIVLSPPAGTVHSGLHTLDTYSYLTAMRHAGADDYSPYALCDSPVGDSDPSLYTLPHHRLYGFLGAIGRILGLSPFLYLGVLHGLGVLFLLGGAYSLLRLLAPALAGRGLLLYAWGGGLGGMLYIATSLLGLQASPLFPEYFLRYFLYDLSEGPRFQPYLLLGRLYYTFPMGMGFLGLASLILWIRRERGVSLAVAIGCLALCAFLNSRLGPMFWVVGVLALFVESGPSRRARTHGTLAITCATLLGMLPALLMLSRNPELSKGVFASLRGAMWFSPFLSATFWNWAVLPFALFAGLRRAPRFWRTMGWAAAGYLLAYAGLYVLYQRYYGNFWRCLDVTVAIRMCDWALLLGAPPGAVYGFFREGERREGEHREGERTREPDPRGAPNPNRLAGTLALPPIVPSWVTLWFLLFTAVSISAFGQGWLLQYMPQRFMVMLGLPLALLSAEALHTFRPWIRRTLWTLLVGSGIASVAVTWGVVYGPLGYHTAQRHFLWTNSVFIPTADAEAINTLTPGVVLAPSLGDPLYGDVLAQRPGFKTVYGNGTLDFSRSVMNELRREVAEFFTPGMTPEERERCLRGWCVAYVYCPSLPQLPPELLAELHALPLLEATWDKEGVTVFKVNAATRP